MKILFLGANPAATGRLDIASEAVAIEESIRSSSYRSHVTLHLKDAVDAARLVRSLRELKPDIVHFSGHGEDGRIVLRYGDDYRLVDPDDLVKMLRPLGLKLLFLNCCYSIADEKKLASAAQSVIGTTAAVSDKVAIEFARQFYRNICDGYGVDIAYVDAQRVVNINQGNHSPFHRIGVDDLRFFEGLPVEDAVSPPAGAGCSMSRKLGSIHLHIDGAKERQLVKSAIASHIEKGYFAEESSVIEFIKGDQREEEPEVYQDHTPGVDVEELDYFSTTCLHEAYELPDTAGWQKIKAATRDVLVQLNVLESRAASSGVVLELERVVGTVDCEGKAELAPQLRMRDSDMRDMFDRQDLLFEPRYPKADTQQMDKLYELHFSLDLPRGPNDRTAPLALADLRTLSKQASLKIGGWFLFDDSNRWAYRSNGFERMVSKALLETTWTRFNEVLKHDLTLRQSGYTLRLIAEETVSVWKSPLKRYPGVFTVPELARWEATLSPLSEFWVVAPNFLGDQDARVFEAMSKQLRQGVRYIYFLKSHADARRWISFREDLRQRLQFVPNMDAYVVEFADRFWDTSMTFIANPHSREPAAMRLLTDRLNKQIIGGILAEKPVVLDLTARLESALSGSLINRCERVITSCKRDVIATVCLHFVAQPAEANWEDVFDDLLAKQVSVSQGEIVRYGGHTIVVLFSGERGGLVSAVPFARDLAARIAKEGPAWEIRLGIAFSDGQLQTRANGMSWSGRAIHDAKAVAMDESADHMAGRILVTQAAADRLRSTMQLWQDLHLDDDGNGRYWLRRSDGTDKAIRATPATKPEPQQPFRYGMAPQSGFSTSNGQDAAAGRTLYRHADFREVISSQITRILGRWDGSQGGAGTGPGDRPADNRGRIAASPTPKQSRDRGSQT